MDKWETKEVLMLVKTYPSPSKKYRETVCTAGITSDGQLIRLYPISFRYLDDDKQFEKYRWIRADVKKNREDNRPESYRINYDSISLLNRLDATKDADSRIRIIEPLVSPSLESIYAKHEEQQISLGIFKPRKILDFIVREVSPDWTQRRSYKIER